MNVDWVKSSEPLLGKYWKRKHPLDYANRYQLVVMVILSAQTNDNLINKVAKEFFIRFPSMHDLATASIEQIMEPLKTVRNFRHKATWLSLIAQKLGDEKNMPTTLEEITKLPGIGRKSANVIMRESGNKPEGIMVDLHVIRVANRLGISEGDTSDKVERPLMAIYPRELWGEIGMAMSYLGREICRPKPNCPECMMKNVCQYYNTVVKPALINTAG